MNVGSALDRITSLEEALAEAQRQRENAQHRTADLRREIKNLIADNKRLREEQPERIELEKKIARLKAGLAQSKYNGGQAAARAERLAAALNEIAHWRPEKTAVGQALKSAMGYARWVLEEDEKKGEGC